MHYSVDFSWFGKVQVFIHFLDPNIQFDHLVDEYFGKFPAPRDSVTNLGVTASVTDMLDSAEGMRRFSHGNI